MATHDTREVEEFIKKWHELGIPNGCLIQMREYHNQQLQKAREEHERKIDELRQHIATLCAAGCECCRDTEVWKAESAVIAVMLGIPAYDDGSGFDFYKVRDSYHSELDQDKK